MVAGSAAVRAALSRTALSKQSPGHVTSVLTDLFYGTDTKLKKTDKADPSGDTKSRYSQSKRLHWRSEIVSEKLCDDVLNYLAPTLEQHKGASIIDVNPGSCVWSQRLHEFLKPKRHLLMEPEEEYYEPFIKPLLEAPGSKYTYTKLPGAHFKSYWGNYSTVLNDATLMPPRPPLEHDDPKLRELDTSFLVVGNLWRRSDRKLKNHEVNLAPLILQHMTYGALGNDIFHRAGLVRMLWWIPEDRMLEVMATNPMSSAAITYSLELGADIVQVAGTISQEQHLMQESYYASRPIGLQSIARSDAPRLTAQLKADRGIDRPALSPTWTGDDEPIEGPNPLSTSCTSPEQLRELVEEFQLRTGVIKGPLKHSKLSDSEIKELERALIYPQCIAAVHQSNWRKRLLGSAVREVKIMVCLDLSLQVLHLEAEIAALTETMPEHPMLNEIRELVLENSNSFDALLLEETSDQLRLLLNFVFEHMRMAYVTPAVVARDGRPFEPLQAQEDEFWPPHKMALLMLTPKARDFTVDGLMSRVEGAKTCQELVKQLYYWRASPLPTVLNRVAPGAADLIAQVPAVTDARKGGRLNPMNVKSREISAETLGDLIAAFCEWPFKPTTLQLMLASEDVSMEDAEEPAKEDTTET